MRTPLIAGNWKMNGSLALVDAFAQAVAERGLPAKVDVALMLPAPYLQAAHQAFAGLPVSLGGQTLYHQQSGAFTGEVSGSMLSDCGAHYVLVGHSERRELFGEDDAEVLSRVQAALSAGLTPVLCVGETLQERDAGRTEEVVLGQLAAVFDALAPDDRSRLVVAYEPVWAIGTGRTATPEQAQEVHAYIRSMLAKHDARIANSVRILYGGSVKASNAKALFTMSDIDGGLVGGASLDASEFSTIIRAAS